jgi:integrase
MSVTQGVVADGLLKEKVMPKLPTNLARIGAVYKFRSRIPQDLLAFYSPKREIVESLNTKDLAVAKRRLPLVQNRYYDEWERIRQSLFESKLLGHSSREPLQQPSPKTLPINNETISYITSLLEHSSLAGDEQTRLAGNYTLEEIQEYRQRLTESIDFFRDKVSVGDTAAFLPPALQLLGFQNIEVTGSEEDYRRLSLAYARSALQTNEALLKQMNGQVVERPEIQTPKALGKPKIPLYSLFEYWRDLVPNRRQKTIDDFEKRIKDFDEMTGKKSAELLTRADFIAYRDLRLTQVSSAGTVRKDLSFIKAVMQQALEAEKIPSNPAALIKVPEAKGASKAKRNLTPEDIQVILSSPIYTDNKRPIGGAGEAAAWVPLIAYFTGSRIEEICQLTVGDIKKAGSIHYFSMQLILDDEDLKHGIKKKMKNDASRRSVPIHQKLLDAGLLDYVELMKQEKQTWLFPKLVPNKYDQRSANFSKWWVNWRRSIGITGSHRCFHASRHSFKTACRGARIGEDFHDALTGHASTGEGRNYGEFPLTALNEELQKVNYPGLQFDWVWKQVPEKLTARQQRLAVIINRMEERANTKPNHKD